MIFLDQYINNFLADADPLKQDLGRHLLTTKQSYDIFNGADPEAAFQSFVDQYNWLGDETNKTTHNIKQNLSRNLTGALMQDYLIHLMLQQLQLYPTLDVFTEVKVEFGTYPVWQRGEVRVRQPAHYIDITVGYRSNRASNSPVMSNDPWPRPAISHLQPNEVVIPLIGISSKIRVSQGEFFDWLGRDQLLTKGNPHCLSIQVGLRTEMDLSIIEICQATDKFFVLGQGGERNVVSRPGELKRLIDIINKHLVKRMS